MHIQTLCYAVLLCSAQRLMEVYMISMQILANMVYTCADKVTNAKLNYALLHHSQWW